MVLELVDASLEALLRAAVPLSATDVDVAFDAPSREWSGKLNRPTVNLFLWDIKRSTDHARAGVETVIRNEQPMRRLVLPRVELRYLVTAWTSEHRDERVLLSELLRVALTYQEIPEGYIAAGLADIAPPRMMVARSGETHMDIFQTLEGQLKPALDLVVITEVDTGGGTPLAAPVTDVGVNISDIHNPARRAGLRRVAGEVQVAGAVGAHVTSPRGGTSVNTSGRFLIAAHTGDEIVVHLDPPRTALVPAFGGVVIT
jgi:Pvc16 N-terminal domain